MGSLFKNISLAKTQSTQRKNSRLNLVPMLQRGNEANEVVLPYLFSAYFASLREINFFPSHLSGVKS